MLKERVITALSLFIVLLGLVFFAPERLWFAAIGGMMAWAAGEWAGLAKFGQWAKSLYVMMMPMVLALLWVAFEHPSRAYSGYWLFGVVMLLSVSFWLIIVPLWLWRGWQIQSRAVLALCGALVLLPAGLCFLYIRRGTAEGWFLLGLLMTVWIADVAAYFVGRRFGRHKLAPSISPGKTVEGAVGALVAVSLYLAVVLRWWRPDGFALLDVSWLNVVVLGFLLTYQSILGDLYESWLKRCAGVKDSGSFLPGHGGILDRIDAVLAVLPFQVVLLGWLSIHYGG